MDFLNYFSRNQHIRNYKKRYSDFKEENHCRPVLLDDCGVSNGRHTNQLKLPLRSNPCTVSIATHLCIDKIIS